MSVLEKNYNLARQKQSKRTQRIVTIVSIMSFGGSLIFGTAQLFSSAFQKPSEPSKTAKTATTAGTSVESEFAVQAREYELVLQREPENKTALQGLANVRLQMNDAKGALEAWEKLVKLNPDRQDYKMQLEKTKQKLKGSEGDR